MEKTLIPEKCFYQSTRYSKHPFIRSLRKEFGNKGFALTLVILEMICEEGIEVKFSRKFRETIIKEFPDIKPCLVTMVVRRMTDEGFLDKKAFQERKVLTPPANYIASCQDDILSGKVDKNAPYYFIYPKESMDSSENNGINSETILINTEEKGINSEEIRINTEQSDIYSELSRRNDNSDGISSECFGNIQNKR